MSIFDASDIYVWRTSPPEWDADRHIWRRLYSTPDWPPQLTIVARCSNNMCRSCCVTSGGNRYVCQCGATVHSNNTWIAYEFPDVCECPTCSSVLAICRHGICGIAVPLIQTQLEDTI